MATKSQKHAEIPAQVLAASKLSQLFDALANRNYEIIGPTVRDGAVALDQIQSSYELPFGWQDEQSAGHYRLQNSGGQSFFAFAAGPQSWKKYLHPAEVRLWSAERENGTFRILNNPPERKRPFAFIGVRACDLAAIGLQDRVLMLDRYQDPIYSSRRKDAFLVAVQCTNCASTCFCASVGTGPRVKRGFDLTLTELVSEQGHCFLVRAGSKRGTELLAEMETTPASDELLRAEGEAIEVASRKQVREVDVGGIKESLNRIFDDPRWETVAARCMSCGNCTMVCPTCFCSTVEDASDLSVERAERWRKWDSCFTLSFSYIHGGSVRASATARYRQWLMHKFASWIDQFGALGCVGCGRCITWCPVGIDVTEGIRSLREGGANGNA